MRRAAKYAGILLEEFDDSEHFLLALEPESAALPCLLYKDVEIGESTRFLVFDAGGGTVDLAVYETTEGTTEKQFKLRQLSKASGGTCGGNSINGEMLRYVETILGSENFRELEKMPAMQLLERNLEQFKIGYTLEKVEDDDEFFIPVPTAITRFFEKLNLDDDVFDRDEGEIVIPGADLKSIYSRTINEALSYVEKVYESTECLHYIFMVGGFSACNLLYNAVRNKFHNKQTKVVKPSQPGIRVLQGAIWFAKNPKIIASRCSPLTYGVNVTDRYRDCHLRKENVVQINGVEYSQNLFKVMIRMGEIVETGTKVKIGVRAMKSDFATFEVYSSTKANPVYVTNDKSVQKLITVTIPLSKVNQRFDVFMIFGETELKFEILDSDTKEKIIHTAIFEFSEYSKQEKKREDKPMIKKKMSAEKKKKRTTRQFYFDEDEKQIKEKPPVPKRSKRSKPPPMISNVPPPQILPMVIPNEPPRKFKKRPPTKHRKIQSHIPIGAISNKKETKMMRSEGNNRESSDDFFVPPRGVSLKSVTPDVVPQRKRLPPPPAPKLGQGVRKKKVRGRGLEFYLRGVNELYENT